MVLFLALCLALVSKIRIKLVLMALLLMPIIGVVVFYFIKVRSQEMPLGVVPGLNLTERSGKRFNLAELRGSVWVAGFIFTNCQGQCPMLMSHMSRLQKDLLQFPQVKLVSFTVDPKRDTPTVLSEYAQQWGASPDRWLFLRAQPEDLQKLLKETFKLTGPGEGNGSEAINHSFKLALVDRWGKVRGYHDGTDEGVIPKLVSRVRRLVDERF